MKNKKQINLISKNMRAKKFIKSSLQKARARDNRWNKNNELIQDDFEPHVHKEHDNKDYDKQDELEVFRKVKPWGDL